jgi:hypothetical protein
VSTIDRQRGFGIRGHSPERGKKKERRDGEKRKKEIAGAKCVDEVNPVSAVTAEHCIGRS